MLRESVVNATGNADDKAQDWGNVASFSGKLLQHYVAMQTARATKASVCILKHMLGKTHTTKGKELSSYTIT
jgi:hypothetical protein